MARKASVAGASKSTKGSKKMLSDKILEKMNKPKMADFDIEDEEFNNRGGNDASNNVDDNDADDDDLEDQREREELAKREHYVSVGKSKIRNDRLEVGSKYTGAKVGRGELYAEEEVSHFRSDEEESEDDILADVTDSEAENDSGEDDGEEDDAEEFKGFDSENDEDEEEGEDEEGDEDEDNEDEDEDEAFKREKIEKLLDSEKKQILSRLSTSAKSDALKGYAVIKQNSQYDKILDSRIKLQKAVVSSNNLPINGKVFADNKTEHSDSILESTEEKLYSLIERLIRLRSNQLVKDGLVKNEIPVKISKKRKLSELLEANKKIDDAMAPVSKSVLMKWSNRVQSASGVGALNQGKFTVVNQSVWSQVNNQLGDLERLVKKTKINRRNAKPIGYEEELANQKRAEGDSEDDEDEDDDQEEVKAAGLSNIDKSLQINPYIFDDDDFYRLLLNDMINKKLDQKQANNSAVLLLSKNKMQKSYDRMATKGRKLKYTVQEPIAQFEIPRRKYYSWGDDQIDELFAGLFGMRIDMDDSENDLDNMEENNLDEQKIEDVSALKQSGVKLFG